MNQVLRRPRQGPRRLWQNAPHHLRWLFVIGLIFILLIASGFAWWAWKKPDPRSAHARAVAIVERRVELGNTADTTWAYAMADGRQRLTEDDPVVLQEQWIGFVRPRFPPFLCSGPQSDGGSSSEARQLARTIEQFEANALGDDAADGENIAVATLQGYMQAENANGGSFLHSYNAANAAVRLGRMPWAVEFLSRLHPMLEELPSLAPRSAASHRRRYGLGESDIARVFLVRYLGGLIQLEREGLGEEAISLFRLAINSFNYLPERRGSHAQELPMSSYPAWACAEGEADDPLTSLDAYSGLVTAYLRTNDYSHPELGALADEVERSAGDWELDDPFRPLLSYAAYVATNPASSAIPENFFWAASNIQRVRHHNRIEPPVRLEVARAAVALQLVSHADWIATLERTQGMDACSLLESILVDLEFTGRDLWGIDPGTVSDEKRALAAVSVYVAAAIRQQCARPAEITREARSGLLTAGTLHLLDPIPGIFEARRLRLERSGSGPTAAATIDSVETELGELESGRLPELYRGSDGSESAEFIRSWQRAIFRDLANGLAELAEQRLERSRRSAEGDSLLSALQDATRLANLKPHEVYSRGRLGGLASGRRTGLAFQIRSLSRDYPVLVAVGLALTTAVITVLLFWAILGVWLWDLVSGRGYTREKRQRGPTSEDELQATVA